MFVRQLRATHGSGNTTQHARHKLNVHERGQIADGRRDAATQLGVATQVQGPANSHQETIETRAKRNNVSAMSTRVEEAMRTHWVDVEIHKLPSRPNGATKVLTSVWVG